MSDETFMSQEPEAPEAPADDTPQEENIPAPADEDLDAPGDEKDEQYWQSQYDKLKAERDKEAERMEKVERYEPLLQYIDDPQALTAIEEYIKGGGQTAVNPTANGHEQNGKSQDSPTWEEVINSDFPEPPTRPSDPYDDEAKARFEKEQDDYLRQLTQRERARTERDRQVARQRQQVEARRQQMAQAVKHVKTEFGASEEEAAGFIETMQDEQTANRYYKQLFELYRQKKPSVDEDRLSRLKNKDRQTPGATVPGAREESVDEESIFSFN